MKKIKQNKYVKLILELLQNPRTRAAVILVLWMLFFIFVFSLFDMRGEPSLKTPMYEEMNEWENRNNYEYHIIWTINQDTHFISGIRNENYETFSYQKDTYTLEANQLFLWENDVKKEQESTILLGYDVLKLRPKFLSKMLSYGNLEYTTKYKTGMIKKGYSIPMAKFVELYHQTVITDDSIITMEVVEQDKTVTEISLDLTPFQKYSQELINQYKIQIKYSNIGKVSNIELE